ncbi:discoidin domain-containing protein [Mycoplasma sp. 480]|uniref:discoidin domain-containing protein n=1 Tax=Mycoplasma sp. 480 TaxID=3440155 RepID=UPI003F51A80D
MNKKYKKIFFPLLLATLSTSLIVVSCNSNNNNDNINSEQFPPKNPNPNFKEGIYTKVNSDIFKIKETVNDVSRETNFIVQEPILYFNKGKVITKQDLPKTVLIINNTDFSFEKEVVWDTDFEEKILIDYSTTIQGHIKDYPSLTTQLTIYTRTQVDGDEYVRSVLPAIDELSARKEIDYDKSTKIFNQANYDFWKMLDSDQGIESRWDNRDIHNRHTSISDRTIVFKWDERKSISQIRINWFKNGWGGSTLPETFYFSYSNDGENWTEVTNLDKNKGSQFDITPANPLYGANVSNQTVFNFDPINTRWFKFSWDSAKTANGGDSMIGITDFQFWVKNSLKILTQNSNSSFLKSVLINNKPIENFNSFKTSYDIELPNLEQLNILVPNQENLRIQIKEVLSEVNIKNNTKIKSIFKILVTDENNNTTIYKLNLSKK